MKKGEVIMKGLTSLYKGFFKDYEQDILYCDTHKSRIIIETIFVSLIVVGLLFPLYKILPSIFISLLFLPFGFVIAILSILKVNQVKIEEISKAKELYNLKVKILASINKMGELMYHNGYKNEKIMEKKILLEMKVAETNNPFDLIRLHEDIILFILDLEKNDFKHTDSSSSYNEKELNNIGEYLKVLGLNNDISDFSAIKKQYRMLVKKYHPDINKTKEAEDYVKALNIAYDELEKHYNKR